MHRLFRFLKYLAALALYYSGFLNLWSFLLRWIRGHPEVCVLGFHRVLAEDDRANSLDGIVLSEATFAKTLDFIGRRYRVISLDEFLTGRVTDANPSQPWCLLTFDDGWRDNYIRAYPELRKRGLPATIFLTAGLIGTQHTFWVEQIKLAWNEPSWRECIESRIATEMEMTGKPAAFEDIVEYLKHMTAEKRRGILEKVLPAQKSDGDRANVDLLLAWDQVLEMSREGIEFGAHTVTHPLLTYEPDESVQYELASGKQMIEEKLRTKVRAFAYPNGDWDHRIRRMVAEAGYECAFSARLGRHRREDDPFTIRRILLHEGKVTDLNGQFSPAMLSLTLAGWR